MLCCGTICGGGVGEGTMLLAQLLAGFQSPAPLLTNKLGPSGADSPGGWFCVCSRTLWVSPMNSSVSLGISAMSAPHRFFQSEGLRLYFPVLEPWIVWSVSLPSCSSQFIPMQIWDCPVLQPPALPQVLSTLAAHLCPSCWSG